MGFSHRARIPEEADMAGEHWCFLGGGNMASAIIGGFLAARSDATVQVVEPDGDKRAYFKSLGCECYSHINELENVDRLVIAVKPQMFPSVTDSLNAALSPGALVVSIMVGLDCSVLSAAIPKARWVRVMPNTPMMVGKGMSGIALGPGATNDDYESTAQLFGASGGVLRVEEEQIDRVAAISGSGPAYFFLFCEILQRQAIEVCGFDEEQAKTLVAHTAEGSIAYLLSQDGFPAAQLRKQVTSPGGTTQAAIGVMEGRDLNGIIGEALGAALSRADELNDLAKETG